MTWDSKDSELRCRLAAKVYKNPVLFKPLAEWLDCYQYILPDNRETINACVMSDDPAAFYNHWEWLRVVQCSLTHSEQVASWKLINAF